MLILKKLSIRTQLLILEIATAFIIVSSIVIFYFQVSDMTVKNNNAYTNEISFQIRQMISANYDLLNSVVTNAACNRIVQDYMMEKNDYNRVLQYYNVDNFFLNMQGLHKGIIDIAVISNSENNYYLQGRNDKLKLIADKITERGVYFSAMQQLTYLGKHYNCFVMGMPVFSVIPDKMLGSKIGVAVIVLDPSMFSFKPSRKYKDWTTKFYLLDRDGVIYSSSDYKEIGSRFSEIYNGYKGNNGKSVLKTTTGNLIINKESIPEQGGTIISVIPENLLLKDLNRIRAVVVAILVFSGCVLAILFFLIIKNILSPLRKFMIFISSIKEGNLKGLKKRINLEGYVEVSTMAYEFNNLLEEIDSLSIRLVNTSTILYKTELEKKQAEIAYLKNQINPHFLYNTLESLKGMAIDEGAPKTMGMAKALGQIFRYSVKGEDNVTVREELKMVMAYVQIQQIRFEAKLESYFSFPDEVMNLRMPKMILQPLVENAICHGLEKKVEKGSLWITAEIESDRMLVISVKDDGLGIAEKRLSQICSELNGEGNIRTSQTENNSSIGLMNVNNRLKLIFGNEYGVQIRSILGEGTQITVRMPVERGLNV